MKYPIVRKGGIQMRLVKITAIICSICVLLCACGNKAPKEQLKPEPSNTLSGNPIDIIDGTTGKFDFKYSDESKMISDMTLACKNDKYSLYYNQKSLATALVDNKTGEIFLSNPYNASLDPFYSGDVAKKLSSQIIIDYYNSDNACNSMYSSADCAELGQYKISTYEDGIRFDLSLGEEKENLLNPAIFTSEEFQFLLSKMSGRDAGLFEAFYMYVDINQVTDATRKNELKNNYPIIEKTPLYVLTELNDNEKVRLNDALNKAGYTKEDYLESVKKYNLSQSKESYPNFKLSMVYRLTDYGISVTIPHNSISFNKDFSLSSISVLPYFAADCEKSGEDGYLFIPDGSGSLININGQDAQRRRLITNRVYGYDTSLNQSNNLNAGGMQYYLPTFGIKRNNGSAVAAIIEKGDEMSEITASLGNPNSNYYTTYNTFIYTAGELVIRESKISSMGSTKPIYLYDKNLSDSDYTISYHFLSGNDADYSGMARVYRNFLMENGMKENEKNGCYMGIETVGSALYKTSFFGFQYNADAVFTTYNQNIKILDYFKNNGLNNLSLSLRGWQDKGIDCSITNKLKFSSALGGKSKFENLKDYCEINKFSLFPLVDFAFTANDVSGDEYKRGDDAARQLSREYSLLADDNLTAGKNDKSKNVLSPIRYDDFFKYLIDSCKKNKVSSLGLESFGSYLNSDFDEDKSINRTQTKLKLEKLFKNNKTVKLSFIGANAYVLPFASMVSDIPLTDSGYPGESTSVPFLQLVINGCVNYESSAINLMNDPDKQLLYCIASGTSPKFMLAYDNIEKLKLTDYTEYYAISFDVLKKDILKYGKYVNKALEVTDGSKLKEHKQIANGVTASYFENGAVIYVNTSDKDFIIKGKIVEAKNYCAVNGRENNE